MFFFHRIRFLSLLLLLSARWNWFLLLPEMNWFVRFSFPIPLLKNENERYFRYADWTSDTLSVSVCLCVYIILMRWNFDTKSLFFCHFAFLPPVKTAIIKIETAVIPFCVVRTYGILAQTCTQHRPQRIKDKLHHVLCYLVVVIFLLSTENMSLWTVVNITFLKRVEDYFEYASDKVLSGGAEDYFV